MALLFGARYRCEGAWQLAQLLVAGGVEPLVEKQTLAEAALGRDQGFGADDHTGLCAEAGTGNGSGERVRPNAARGLVGGYGQAFLCRDAGVERGLPAVTVSVFGGLGGAAASAKR